MTKTISMKEFVPTKIFNSNNNGKCYNLYYKEDDFCLTLYYKTHIHNASDKEHCTIIPKEISKSIIEEHNQHPDWTAQRIADKTGVSAATVARIRRKNGLSKPKLRTTPEQYSCIIKAHKENPDLGYDELGKRLEIANHRVRRAIDRYRRESIAL